MLRGRHVVAGETIEIDESERTRLVAAGRVIVESPPQPSPEDRRQAKARAAKMVEPKIEFPRFAVTVLQRCMIRGVSFEPGAVVPDVSIVEVRRLAGAGRIVLTTEIEDLLEADGRIRRDLSVQMVNPASSRET